MYGRDDGHVSRYRRCRVADAAVVVNAPDVAADAAGTVDASFQCCPHHRAPDAVEPTESQGPSFLDFASIFFVC